MQRPAPTAPWLLAVLVLGGIALLILQSALQPDTALSRFQWGLLQVIYTHEESLPLLAVGAALAKISFLPRLAGILTLALGFAGGQFVMSSLLPLFGPLGLMIGGIALAVPARASSWAVPVFGGIIGLIVSVIVRFNAPDGLDFLLGSAVAIGWLIAVAFTAGLAAPVDWLRIASPIVGSWLAAIGLLLVTLYLVPRPPPLPRPAVNPPADVQQTPQP
jgi:hypothetical protein